MATEFTVRPLNKTDLIAPCGMNCGICYVHLRRAKSCPGCRADDGQKPKTRVQCKIKNCQVRRGKFCISCAGIPCPRLSHLDNRYRAKYGMSMLDNLRRIDVIGLKSFAIEEEVKWRCAGCGATIAVHKDSCLGCKRPWR